VSVFVDTGLFYAVQGSTTSRHETANQALSTILEGSYGRAVTTNYVVEEAATLVRSRSGDFSQAKQVIDRILGRGRYPDVFDVHHVDPSLFRRGIDTFERYNDHDLSLTDATTVALVESASIDHVLTFDNDFDGIVDRLDPDDL
jgi:predicted nucleic acid-binding protein